MSINDARGDDDGTPAALPRRHITVIDDDALDRACALGMTAGGLYAKLERRANKEGRCHGTLDQLATEFNCSVRHVRDALAKLKNAGLVVVEATFGPTGLQLGNEFVLPHHRTNETPENPSNSRAEPTMQATTPNPHNSRAEPTPEPTPEPSRAHVMEVSSSLSSYEVNTLAGDPAAAGGRQRYSVEFETFWTEYGATNGPKKPAYTAWQRLSQADRAAARAALPAWHASEKWCANFKPYPQKYLNQRHWEANPETGTQAPVRSASRQAEIDRIKAEARTLSQRPSDPNHPGRARL